MMKKQCMDVANPEEEKEIEKESCINDCSDNGACENGKCKCNQGFVGADCSRSKSFDFQSSGNLFFYSETYSGI